MVTYSTVGNESMHLLTNWKSLTNAMWERLNNIVNIYKNHHFRTSDPGIPVNRLEFKVFSLK